MAGETPQAGDVWQIDGTTYVVCGLELRDMGEVRVIHKSCHHKRGWAEGWTLLDRWPLACKKIDLLVRDGKPYQPAPSGDVVTVEMPVFRTAHGSMFVDWDSRYSTLESQRNRYPSSDHVATVRADIPKASPPVVEGTVSLPPVTAVR